MLASGFSRAQALGGAAALGAATVLGVGTMGILGGFVNYALPLSAGVTLYVAASDLIPEVNKEPGVKMAFVVFAGVAMLFGMETLFGHHH
jgi:ZIP family zinc transporter/zinc and cadmium transporter